MSKVPLGTTRKTGEKSPESGIWKAEHDLSTTIPLSKGETSPLYNNKAVVWKLISYA